MDPTEFAKLVQKMRHAQREYFKAERGTVDKSRWLEESKRLEKAVDEAAREVLEKQKGLF